MIILSQDKDEIVNFNRTDSIWICSDEEGRFSIEAAANTNATLGYYKTKERAKEVLQEIKMKYADFAKIQNVAGNDIRQIAVIPRVYEMPKE